MQRTYSKSGVPTADDAGGSSRRDNLNLKWREQNKDPFSDEETDIRFRVKTKRPALIALNSLENSPVLHPIGKPSTKDDDTFDKLFQNVNLKKIAAPLAASCISGSDRSSDFSSSASHSRSQDQHYGLFQSFSRDNGPKDSEPLPKKKSNRRLKSQTTRRLKPAPETDIPDLHNTLDVVVKYKQRDSARDKKLREAGSPEPVFVNSEHNSTLATAPNTPGESPLIDMNLKAKTRSCLTSTPLLTSASSMRAFSAFHPSQPVSSVGSPENEVFLDADSSLRHLQAEPFSPRHLLPHQIEKILSTASISQPAGVTRGSRSSSYSRLAPTAVPRSTVLSSNEIIPSSVPSRHPLTVNDKRGKKEMGGPALSLFRFEQGQETARLKPPLEIVKSDEEEKSEFVTSPSTGIPGKQSGKITVGGGAERRLAPSSAALLSPSPSDPLSTQSRRRRKVETRQSGWSRSEKSNGAEWRSQERMLPEEEEEDDEGGDRVVQLVSGGSSGIWSNRKIDSAESTSPGRGLYHEAGNDSSISSSVTSSAGDIIEATPPQPSFRNLSRSLRFMTRSGLSGMRVEAATGTRTNSRMIDSSQPYQSLLSEDPSDLAGISLHQLDCICGIRQETEALLIGCQRCHGYFHPTCLGLTDEDIEDLKATDDEWFCPGCLVAISPAAGLPATSSALGYDEAEGTPQEASDQEEEEAAAPQIEARPEKEAGADSLVDCLEKTGWWPQTEEEGLVMAKPGKNWRRSLSISLMTSQAMGENSVFFPPPPPAARLSLARRCEPVAELMLCDEDAAGSARRAATASEFLAPRPPSGAGPLQRRSSKRLSARISAFHAPPRQSFFIPQNIIEEEEVEEECNKKQVAVEQGHSIEQGLRKLSLNITAKRVSRASFMIVSGATGAITPALADISLLLEPQLTPLDKLAAKCWRRRIVTFSDAYPDHVMADARKVGEGAFGEVYLLGSGGADRPVLKIVPVGGAVKVNDENQAGLTEMLSEVVISNTLSNLRHGAANWTQGFVEVRKCSLFQGQYPPPLLKLWDLFDQEKGSENYRPDYLPDNQLYVGLEFNNGGKDLEKYEFRNASQAFAAWCQVAHSLAVAEQDAQFEHRDLHWGNVLIKETSAKQVTFRLAGDVYSVDTLGVETTIIDFSLSRLTSREDRVTIFNNLAEDPTLFTAGGLEKGGDYQFDIYRMMRRANNNSWEEFLPKTNVFWLHYMLSKMTTEVYYKAKKNSNPHKAGLKRMRELQARLVEDYGSAGDWVRREGSLILN